MIFLGASDVLGLPENDVIEYLNAIREVFRIEAADHKQDRDFAPVEGDAAPRFEGVHILLDEFGTARWVEARGRRLRPWVSCA